MTILALDHVQLSMPAGGEDRARRFYGELLGFIEIPKPASLAGRGGLWLRQGTAKIHLGIEPDFRPLKKAHPALLVDDLAALIAYLQSAGWEVDTSQPPLDGYKRAHVLDPFGNRLELMEGI
jgi:catechol 2,3-dioxygenase-like lactoylglutathione lyase family enzyme